MLRITLNQFRCWENLVIEAPIGGITLIKGSSGVGKSTILQGITWCLYGNIRLVTPNYSEKTKTKVVIELPYNLSGINGTLTINRQKNPNRLLLSHNDKTYEDKVAQSIIDDLFGNYEIWLSSCYIGQNCRNNFLTAPNTGKMELLNSIAFHEEEPTSFIERIDTTITETDTEYKTKLSVFDNNLIAFKTLLGNIDINKALNQEKIIELTTHISLLNKEKISLTEIKSQRHVNIGIMENLQTQLNQVCNTNIVIPEPNANLLALNDKYEGNPLDKSENIDINLQKALDIIPVLQRRTDLYLEVKKFDSLLLPYINIPKSEIDYTVSDYQNALSKEMAYKESQKLAQNLGVLYSEISINQNIQRNKSMLENQERLKLEQEKDILESKISMMELEHLQQSTPLIFPDITPQIIPPPDYTKYNTDALTNEISELSKRHGAIQSNIDHLKKGHDVLQCPYCKGSLRYQQGKLATAETAPTTQDEIYAAQQEFAKVNGEIIRLNKLIQDLNSEKAFIRDEYEKSVIMEQKRIDSLKERVKQLELEKQRREIANQNRAKQIKEEKDKLQSLIDNINVLPEISSNDRVSARVLSLKEIEQTHNLIAKLEGINILMEPKISSQQIQSHINYQELVGKNTDAINIYNKYLETIPIIFRDENIKSVQIYIDELRNHWNKIKESASEQSRLNHLKISLDGQIKAIRDRLPPDPTQQLNQLNSDILSLQENIDLSARAHQAIKFHNQITKEREDVISVNNILSDLHTLRQHAVETECRILQQMVDSINESIQGVCGTLFDKEINITLSLFRTMKTTKNVKPVANFSISYQGGVFDNINQMSGGEGDRASLALTLALNRLSSCPILMLDESLASLDLNMKEAAIRAIRENTNNTVLVIVHDGIEGIFDSIINMDEIRENTPLA